MQNWVELVGYQHEVVHTGALDALLSAEPHGTKIAQRLAGRGDVRAVARSEWETHAGGRKGTRADLVSRREMADDSLLTLAVEMKVDSWRRASRYATRSAPTASRYS